jgi:hypothetical protein
MPPVATVGNESSAAKGLRSLFKDIGSAYNELIKRGRDADAFALRDAAQRFAAAGSKFGVNEFARTQALTDLKARMTAASEAVAAKNTAAKLQAQASVLDRLAGVEATEFAQEMDKARLDEQKRSNLFREDLATQQLEAQKEATGVKLRLGTEAARAASSAALSRTQEASLNRRSPLVNRRTRPVSPVNTAAVEAATRIKQAEQGLQKRTAGGFLTTGVGRDDIMPRDVVTAGSLLRGGGGFRSRGRVAKPAVSSPVAPRASTGASVNTPLAGTPIRR